MRVRPLHRAAVEAALESGAARQIVAACIASPRTVKDISEAAGIPLASCYRQVKALVDDGILVVERSAMTGEGKAVDLYRSRVRVARLEVRDGRVDVSWDLNAALEDRVMHIWGQLRV